MFLYPPKERKFKSLNITRKKNYKDRVNNLQHGYEQAQINIGVQVVKDPQILSKRNRNFQLNATKSPEETGNLTNAIKYRESPDFIPQSPETLQRGDQKKFSENMQNLLDVQNQRNFQNPNYFVTTFSEGKDKKDFEQNQVDNLRYHNLEQRHMSSFLLNENKGSLLETQTMNGSAYLKVSNHVDDQKVFINTQDSQTNSKQQLQVIPTPKLAVSYNRRQPAMTKRQKKENRANYRQRRPKTSGGQRIIKRGYDNQQDTFDLKNQVLSSEPDVLVGILPVSQQSSYGYLHQNPHYLDINNTQESGGFLNGIYKEHETLSDHNAVGCQAEEDPLSSYNIREGETVTLHETTTYSDRGARNLLNNGTGNMSEAEVINQINLTFKEMSRAFPNKTNKTTQNHQWDFNSLSQHGFRPQSKKLRAQSSKQYQRNGLQSGQRARGSLLSAVNKQPPSQCQQFNQVVQMHAGKEKLVNHYDHLPSSKKNQFFKGRENVLFGHPSMRPLPSSLTMNHPLFKQRYTQANIHSKEDIQVNKKGIRVRSGKRNPSSGGLNPEGKNVDVPQNFARVKSVTYSEFRSSSIPASTSHQGLPTQYTMTKGALQGSMQRSKQRQASATTMRSKGGVTSATSATFMKMNQASARQLGVTSHPKKQHTVNRNQSAIHIKVQSASFNMLQLDASNKEQKTQDQLIKASSSHQIGKPKQVEGPIKRLRSAMVKSIFDKENQEKLAKLHKYKEYADQMSSNEQQSSGHLNFVSIRADQQNQVRQTTNPNVDIDMPRVELVDYSDQQTDRNSQALKKQEVISTMNLTTENYPKTGSKTVFSPMDVDYQDKICFSRKGQINSYQNFVSGKDCGTSPYKIHGVNSALDQVSSQESQNYLKEKSYIDFMKSYVPKISQINTKNENNPDYKLAVNPSVLNSQSPANLSGRSPQTAFGNTMHLREENEVNLSSGEGSSSKLQQHSRLQISRFMKRSSRDQDNQMGHIVGSQSTLFKSKKRSCNLGHGKPSTTFNIQSDDEDGDVNKVEQICVDHIKDLTLKDLSKKKNQIETTTPQPQFGHDEVEILKMPMHSATPEMKEIKQQDPDVVRRSTNSAGDRVVILENVEQTGNEGVNVMESLSTNNSFIGGRYLRSVNQAQEEEKASQHDGAVTAKETSQNQIICFDNSSASNASIKAIIPVDFPVVGRNEFQNGYFASEEGKRDQKLLNMLKSQLEMDKRAMFEVFQGMQSNIKIDHQQLNKALIEKLNVSLMVNPPPGIKTVNQQKTNTGVTIVQQSNGIGEQVSNVMINIPVIQQTSSHTRGGTVIGHHDSLHQLTQSQKALNEEQIQTSYKEQKASIEQLPMTQESILKCSILANSLDDIIMKTKSPQSKIERNVFPSADYFPNSIKPGKSESTSNQKPCTLNKDIPIDENLKDFNADQERKTLSNQRKAFTSFRAKQYDLQIESDTFCPRPESLLKYDGQTLNSHPVEDYQHDVGPNQDAVLVRDSHDANNLTGNKNNFKQVSLTTKDEQPRYQVKQFREITPSQYQITFIEPRQVIIMEPKKQFLNLNAKTHFKSLQSHIKPPSSTKRHIVALGRRSTQNSNLRLNSNSSAQGEAIVSPSFTSRSSTVLQSKLVERKQSTAFSFQQNIQGISNVIVACQANQNSENTISKDENRDSRERIPSADNQYLRRQSSNQNMQNHQQVSKQSGSLFLTKTRIADKIAQISDTQQQEIISSPTNHLSLMMMVKPQQKAATGRDHHHHLSKEVKGTFGQQIIFDENQISAERLATDKALNRHILGQPDQTRYEQIRRTAQQIAQKSQKSIIRSSRDIVSQFQGSSRVNPLNSGNQQKQGCNYPQNGGENGKSSYSNTATNPRNVAKMRIVSASQSTKGFFTLKTTNESR